MASNAVDLLNNSSEPAVCASCGTSLHRDELFCPNCRVFLGGTQVVFNTKVEHDPRSTRLPVQQCTGGARSKTRIHARHFGVGLLVGVTAILVLTVVHMSSTPVRLTSRALTSHPAKTVLRQSSVASNDSPAVLSWSEPLEPAVVDIVSLVRRPGGTQVKIIVSRSIKPQITELADPLRLVIDLPSTILRQGYQELRSPAADVDQLRASQYRTDPPTTRVVVRLRSRRHFTTKWESNVLLVDID